MVKVNIATGKASRIFGKSLSDHMGISSKGKDVWVADEGGGPRNVGSVSEIDIATGKVSQIDSLAFDTPFALAIFGNTVWVTNIAGGTNHRGSVSKISS